MQDSVRQEEEEEDKWQDEEMRKNVYLMLPRDSETAKWRLLETTKTQTKADEQKKKACNSLGLANVWLIISHETCAASFCCI